MTDLMSHFFSFFWKKLGFGEYHFSQNRKNDPILHFYFWQTSGGQKIEFFKISKRSVTSDRSCYTGVTWEKKKCDITVKNESASESKPKRQKCSVFYVDYEYAIKKIYLSYVEKKIVKSLPDPERKITRIPRIRKNSWKFLKPEAVIRTHLI